MGAFKYSEQGQTALLTEYFNSFSRLCFLYRIHDWRLEGVPVNLGSLITSTTTAVGGTFPMHFQKFSNCNDKRQELRLCQNGDGVTTAVLKQFQLPGLDRKKKRASMGIESPAFAMVLTVKLWLLENFHFPDVHIVQGVGGLAGLFNVTTNAVWNAKHKKQAEWIFL